MIRIILCDDDEIFLQKLYNRISSILNQNSLKNKIHAFRSMEEISTQILSSADIAFLDVDYSGKNYNGMDIARKLRSLRKDTVIIFVTNFIEYAPEGYEVQAFRYILKRELDSELEPYLRQAVQHLNRHREKLKIQVNGEYIDLIVEDILYMEVLQHNVTIYVNQPSQQTPRAYKVYASLSELEQKTISLGFIRVHKSYLVNMRRIIKFQCREVTLDNGTILRVSEKNYAENKKKYLLWKGQQ